MSLHPEFEAYLAWLNPIAEENARNGVQATPESARAALAGLNQFALAAVPVAEVRDAVVDTDGGPVPVRIYVPRPGVASDTVLFVHGGGHMAGDLDVYDHSARRTADASGMVVVSVDYRRSPEALFPIGLTDTYGVLHGLDSLLAGVATTGRVHSVGDSGGAAKLASIAMRVAAGEWSSPIQRQVLLYPSLDYTMSGESIRDYGTGYFLSAERIAWYFDYYFPADVDRDLASPLSGPYDASMPETLVIAAEYDPLLSEGREYVDRMRSAGAMAHYLVVPGMIHAYTFFEDKVLREIERTYQLIGDFLRTGNTPGVW